MAATSFTTAALIGTALALEVQAIASPAARLRKKSVLRMNVSPEVPVGNERRFPSVPRVQRGARLIGGCRMENTSSCTPSFLRAGAVITRGPEPRRHWQVWQAVREQGQGQVSPPRSLCSGTKTAGAKTRNDTNYAFAFRRRAIPALSSMP